MRTTLALLLALTALANGYNEANNESCDVEPRSWNGTYYPPVCSPNTWICFTTSGGMNQVGGYINRSRCGEMCDVKEAGTEWIGYVGAVVAIVLFGSNFIPVKKFDTGDGIFFQWVLCVGIWLVGLVVNMVQKQPPMFLPALIGGVSWTTGNLLVVPIIKLIGLTMGLTVWGVTNMIAGWFTGMVILGQQVSCPGLNYGGVAVVVISVVLLAFVKTEGKKYTTSESTEPPNETTRLLSERTSSLEGSLHDRVLQKSSKKSSTSIQGDVEKVVFNTSNSSGGSQSLSDVEAKKPVDTDASWVDHLAKRPIISKILAFVLSMVAGLLFGFQFLPIQFLKFCDEGAHSCQDLDYLFSNYCGIFLTSTFYFMIYCAVYRNKPVVYPQVILPGLISGIMWGIAMMAWFLANQHLSLAVSFPIVTAGPGFVSSAWGILVYREIKGWKNIVLFFVAFAVSACGLVMDSLSKCTVHCA